IAVKDDDHGVRHVLVARRDLGKQRLTPLLETDSLGRPQPGCVADNVVAIDQDGARPHAQALPLPSRHPHELWLTSCLVVYQPRGRRRLRSWPMASAKCASV